MKKSIYWGILFSAITIIACKEKTTSNQATDAENKKVETGQQVYLVDPLQSSVKWIGAKPSGTENGIVPISKGTIATSDGKVTGGTIEIDVASLTVLSKDGDMKKTLESHLKGETPGKEEDFFNVSKYPKASYTITSTSALENDPEATHMVNGNLTIKNITKPVNFKARIDVKESVLTASAAPFNIDRTEFDIKFKSKKFFDNLKDDFINDDFQIGFYVVANKQ